MDKKMNCYQKSFAVLRENIGRAVAVFLFLDTVLLFLLMEANLVLSVLPGAEETFRDLWKKENFFILVFFLGLVFLILVPLEMGVRRWFYEISSDSRSSLREIFYYFFHLEIYTKALGLRLAVALRKAVFYALGFVPALLLEWLARCLSSYHSLVMGILYGIVSILSVFAALFGLAFAFYSTRRYFLADFLFFERENEPISMLIRGSVFQMGKERRQRDVSFIFLSLFPFYLLSILVVPLVFLVPYLYLLSAIKGREIIMKDRSRAEWDSSVSI